MFWVPVNKVGSTTICTGDGCAAMPLVKLMENLYDTPASMGC